MWSQNVETKGSYLLDLAFNMGHVWFDALHWRKLQAFAFPNLLQSKQAA